MTLGSAVVPLPCPAVTRLGILFVAVGLREPPRSEGSKALATHAADTEGGAEREPAVLADGPLVGGDIENPAFY